MKITKDQLLKKIKNKIASSDTLEGINKLTNEYFYSDKKLIKISNDIYAIQGKKNNNDYILENFVILFEKNKFYLYELKEKIKLIPENTIKDNNMKITIQQLEKIIENKINKILKEKKSCQEQDVCNDNEEEIDETSTSGGVPGYLTPNAFSSTTNDTISQQGGMKRVSKKDKADTKGKRRGRNLANNTVQTLDFTVESIVKEKIDKYKNKLNEQQLNSLIENKVKDYLIESNNKNNLKCKLDKQIKSAKIAIDKLKKKYGK